MAKNELPTLPLLPEEIARTTRGGNYAESAYAEAVVAGKIPKEEIRCIVGIDKSGNTIYQD